MDPILIESKILATHAVIWLHGLGADGEDFSPLAPQLQAAISPSIRFIFPHAPIRPVTLNNGYEMRAWYDITGLDLNAREDRKGIDETATMLDQLISDQISAGIPAENIFLAGFSQGAASVLYAGLRYPKRLAGILALSGYLPFYRTLEQEASSMNQNIPIFFAHGANDPVIPLIWAEMSRKILEGLHYNIDWHVYPMAHQVCQPEIEDVANWMKKLLTVSDR